MRIVSGTGKQKSHPSTHSKVCRFFGASSAAPVLSTTTLSRPGI